MLFSTMPRITALSSKEVCRPSSCPCLPGRLQWTKQCGTERAEERHGTGTAEAPGPVAWPDTATSAWYAQKASAGDNLPVARDACRQRLALHQCEAVGHLSECRRRSRTGDR